MQNDDVKIHAFRLKPGQDLKQEISSYVQQHKIEAGWIITCVGSITQYNLRFANQPDGNKAGGHFEIVSLVGTVSINGSHLHMSLSDSTGATIGGHLLDSNIVYTTAEIVIGEGKQLVFYKRERWQHALGRTAGETKTVRMFKFSRLQGISLFYAASLLFFTIYWANYSDTYSSKKGEELLTALQVFVFLTFFYFLTLQFSIIRNNWALALFLPIINAIITFLITVVVLWLGSFEGNPKEDILIFGIVYTLLSATTGIVLWKQTE